MGEKKESERQQRALADKSTEIGKASGAIQVSLRGGGIVPNYAQSMQGGGQAVPAMLHEGEVVLNDVGQRMGHTFVRLPVDVTLEDVIRDPKVWSLVQESECALQKFSLVTIVEHRRIRCCSPTYFRRSSATGLALRLHLEQAP